MENFFETSKKSKRRSPLGRSVRGLWDLFNLALALDFPQADADGLEVHTGGDAPSF